MGGDFFIACRAILADCIDDDDAEDETSQCVHGVISIEEALRQCFDGGLIGCLCFLPAAHREECRCDEKDGEEEEECWGDDFPDAADQFRRADGEPPGDHEKDKGEGIECGLLHRFTEEGRDADRIGGRRCTGDGKSRPDGEVEADGEENGVALVDTGGQRFEVAPRIADRCDGEDRETYACQKKAQRRRKGIHACILAHIHRKDQIPCAKEEGKEHQPDRDQEIFLHSKLLS